MPVSSPGDEGFSQLDRPPSLPPDVQPSTFNQLAGQSQPGAGAGPSAGDMQMKAILGQIAMSLEMGLMKLAALVPGSEGLAEQARQLIRQIAIGGLTSQSMGPTSEPMSPEVEAGGVPPQGPPPMAPAMGGMM